MTEERLTVAPDGLNREPTDKDDRMQYFPPVLTRYGDLRSVTLGGTGTSFESGNPPNYTAEFPSTP